MKRHCTWIALVWIVSWQVRHTTTETKSVKQHDIYTGETLGIKKVTTTYYYTTPHWRAFQSDKVANDFIEHGKNRRGLSDWYTVQLSTNYPDVETLSHAVGPCIWGSYWGRFNVRRGSVEDNCYGLSPEACDIQTNYCTDSDEDFEMHYDRRK